MRQKYIDQVNPAVPTGPGRLLTARRIPGERRRPYEIRLSVGGNVFLLRTNYHELHSRRQFLAVCVIAGLRPDLEGRRPRQWREAVRAAFARAGASQRGGA